MKKIKFIIVTLLCMVGVMNVCAQDSEEIVSQVVSTTEGVWTLGGTFDGRTNNSWMSKTTYDGVDGNCLVLDSGGSLNNIISASGSDLSFSVSVADAVKVTLFAPLGWAIEGYDIDAYVPNFAIFNVNVTVTANGKQYKINEKETVHISAGGLENPVEVFSLTTNALHSVVFKNFVVKLKRKSLPEEAINTIFDATVKDHWVWKQEIPLVGNTYKLVNASSTSNELIALGNRNNSTVGQEEDIEVPLAQTIEEAGEWLYGTDYSLTNYADRVVGIYESHFKIGNTAIGFETQTRWRVSPVVVGGVAGLTISSKPNLLVLGRLYLKLSPSFTALGMGNLGWNEVVSDKIFAWNFYSIDQYKCYIAYKDAYDEFVSVGSLHPGEGVEMDDYEKELWDRYDALMGEIDGDPSKGYDDDTRASTYDRIRKMLDLIATIKINYTLPEEDSEEAGLSNPGAEAGNIGWSTATIAPDATFSAVTTEKHGGSNSFRLHNVKMSQDVKPEAGKSLLPGVYHVSVWWKADAGSTITFRAEGVYDKQPSEPDPLIGDGSGKWQQKTLEVVVVTGQRLTVSAAHSGNGNAYLDDFEVVYYGQNYYYNDPETKTRKYKGVFNANSSLNPREDKNVTPYKHINNGPVAIVDTDYPYADITDLSFYSKLQFDNSANPNGLVYANDYTVTQYSESNGGQGMQQAPALPANNVIVKVGDEMKCDNLVLQNGYPYSSRWDFDALSAQYEMKSFGTGKDDTTEDEVTYGTLMLPYSLDNVSATHPNIEVYSTKDVSAKGHLALAKVNKVEANTPYIIKYTKKTSDGEEFKPYFNVLSADHIYAESRNVIKTNCFVGAYKESPIPGGGNCYVLQKQNGRLAFYRVNREDLKISPFRCYLELPEGTTLSKISIVVEDENETDGIRVIEDAESADIVYDLQGRRVESISQSGIYVKNGKKFLVK